MERLLTGSVRVSPASVTLDGAPLPYAGVPLHLVMHKPAGYVCSHSPDTVAREGGKSVYSLLPPSFTLRNPGVASVGRLDRDASGLLLFTDNGQFGERLASPKSHAAKTYVCTLDGPLPPPPGPEKLFSSGKLPLLDGAVAKPAVLTRHPTLPHVVSVTLWEGRHHQLRRMLAACGGTVVGIHRTSFGGLHLGECGLAPGEWRLLTHGEIETLLAQSGRRKVDRK